MEKATFGAGCFWGVEEAFRHVNGVVSTQAGFSGGYLENPSYQDVCAGDSGHAEVVQLEFDPHQVAYKDLLSVFWTIHDPTTPNRQGPDVGEQYRSVIFYHNEEQRRIAVEAKADLEKSGRFTRPVVTAIEPAAPFYRAEEYHQRYLEKRGMKGCHIR
ncbi:MAG TPA: peptide-methionine (S)-S-oxide reductase MsrA [Candidatus Bathyarchaeia archaeon]|nr:peptide-methionine (S)-S-oxide reductase MsrA [Candidatus Bathyarchaeia archaeon]